MAFTEVERRVVFEQLRGARADLHALVDQVSALVDLGLGRQAAETRQTEALVAAIGDSTATLAEAIGNSVRGGAERIRAALVLPAEADEGAGDDDRVPDEPAASLYGALNAAEDASGRAALLAAARQLAGGMGLLVIDRNAVAALAHELGTFPWSSERESVGGADLVGAVGGLAIGFLDACLGAGLMLPPDWAALDDEDDEEGA